MNLSGWILLAVVGIALFGFAMFEIGKRQRKENPSQQNDYSNGRVDEAQQADASDRTEQVEQNQEYNGGRVGGFLKPINDYSGALQVVFAALLVFATWRLWIATRDLVRSSERIGNRQVIQMKKSGDATTRAAQSAEDSVTLSRDNTHLDQRAWAALASITGVPEIGRPYRVTVTVANTGRTFAKKFKLIPIVDPQDADTVPDFASKVEETRKKNEANGAVVISTAMLPPNGTSNAILSASDGNLSEGAFNAIKDGKQRIFVYGKMTYEDVFGCQHWTTFCSFLARTSDGQWNYMVYKEYNDEGDDCPEKQASQPN